MASAPLSSSRAPSRGRAGGGGIVRTIFKSLSDRVGSFSIGHETHALDTKQQLRITVLRPVEESLSMPYQCPFQLPDVPLLRTLFKLEVKPQNELRMGAFRLVPDEEKLMSVAWKELSPRLQRAASDARQYVTLIQDDYDSAPGWLRALYRPGMDMLYFVLRVIVYHWLLSMQCRMRNEEHKKKPPDVALPLPRTLPWQPLGRELHDGRIYVLVTQLQLDDFSKQYGLLVAAYFGDFLLNDLLTYLGTWTSLVSSLMCKRRDDGQMKLLRLAALFAIDPVMFCFDDALASSVAPLQLDIVLARGVARVTTESAPPPRRAATAAVRETLDEHDDPEDDTMMDASEQMERLVREEARGGAAMAALLDAGPYKVRVMSQKDLAALCDIETERFRFPVLMDAIYRASALEAVFIYQQLCSQLRVGNNYCDNTIMRKIHELGDGYVTSNWLNDTVREAAIKMLEERFQVVHKFELEHSPIALALRSTLHTEAFLWRWAERQISLQEKPTSHPLNKFLNSLPDWERLQDVATREMRFDEQQMRATSSILRNRLMVVTGAPGCGKTHWVTRFIRILQKLAPLVSWRFATPTCKSMEAVASNFQEAGVIYEREQLRTAQYYIYYHQRASSIRVKAGFAPVPLEVIDFLFIDEASLWNSQLLYNLLHVFAPKVFVGIGDIDQCMPISWGRPLHVLAAHFAQQKSNDALVKLTTEHRFQGPLSLLAKGIRCADIALMTQSVRYLEPGGGDTLGRLEALLRPATFDNSVVVTVDKNSGLASSHHVAFAQTLTELLYRLDPPNWRCRPPVGFVTFSNAEARDINAACAKMHRRLAQLDPLMLLGGVNRTDWPQNAQQQVRYVDFPQEKQSLKGERYTPWGIQVGDVVAFRRNMAGLHKPLSIDAPYLPVWHERYVLSMPEPVRSLKLAPDGQDYVSNGDRGLLMQIYMYQPQHHCTHQNAGRNKRAAPAAAEDASAPDEPLPLVCQQCMRSNDCVIGGPGWKIKRLLAQLDADALAMHNLKLLAGPWIVLVVWLDRSNELIHIPLPLYEAKTIGYGYAISFFRAQGSQYDNVCFVCSNSRFPSTSAARSGFQRFQERNSARFAFGSRKLDQCKWRDLHCAVPSLTNSVHRLVHTASILCGGHTSQEAPYHPRPDRLA